MDESPGKSVHSNELQLNLKIVHWLQKLLSLVYFYFISRFEYRGELVMTLCCKSVSG